jgi:hypothetical protein
MRPEQIIRDVAMINLIEYCGIINGSSLAAGWNIFRDETASRRVYELILDESKEYLEATSAHRKWITSLLCEIEIHSTGKNARARTNLFAILKNALKILRSNPIGTWARKEDFYFRSSIDDTVLSWQMRKRVWKNPIKGNWFYNI